jgi:hypothetical protein
MDFLLILVAIGGFVVAIVMLVLASRVNRLQKQSDERVETLEAMATGSVLFAHATAGPVFEPAMASEGASWPEPASMRLFPQPEPQPERETLSGRVTIIEPAPLPPLAPPSPATDLDLALNEFADEDELASERSVIRDEPSVVAPSPFAVTAAAYPFVMTVPAAAGVGRVQVSFDRSRRRSRS